MVREIRRNELHELLTLYLHLHENSIPEQDQTLTDAWNSILSDRNHHILIKEVENGRLVSSCVCVIIPNLTRGARPYALIENVVTHADYRKKGYAAECLNAAKQLAIENNCYKIMLLTGAKDEATLNFYKHAGFSSQEKTAFIMKL